MPVNYRLLAAALAPIAIAATPTSAATILSEEGVANNGRIDISYEFDGPSIPNFTKNIRYTLQFDSPVRNLSGGLGTTLFWYYVETDEIAEIPSISGRFFSNSGPISSLSFVLPLNRQQDAADVADILSRGETYTYYIFGLTADFEADGPVGYRFTADYVPEPAAWAFLIFGFGAVGFAMRRRQRRNVAVSYT